MEKDQLRELLERKLALYNRFDFVASDPISIPHRFTKPADIEIAGFFAAIFSWGQRKTIINKSVDLLNRMDNDPHAFIRGHRKKDLQKLLGFAHRNFQDTDLLYFVRFLSSHYRLHPSLEQAFLPQAPSGCTRPPGRWAEQSLNTFYDHFFSLDGAPDRTRKHIAAPRHQSACKRLNMFLRWMVRRDHAGVDFGIWKNISPAELICPIDLHVNRVARRLGLLERKQCDWRAALELTDQLRTLDLADPVKYDFALFGLGIMEHY